MNDLLGVDVLQRSGHLPRDLEHVLQMHGAGVRAEEARLDRLGHVAPVAVLLHVRTARQSTLTSSVSG